MAAWYRAADFLLSRLDAETAHGLAIRALKGGLAPRDQRPDPPSLAVTVWGRTLPNPIGLAAGFDKNAEVPDAMLGMGFGLVEIGSVTPKPQDGNPRPRLFRLGEDRGVINRMGFNGAGLDAALARLSARPRQGFVGVNIGANKDSTNRKADYVTCAAALAPHADYLVCNVSSPNTPGLRNLQGRLQLADLLKQVQDAIVAKPVPLLVKIAPDATDDDLDDIVAVCRDLRMDGIIVGNYDPGAAGVSAVGTAQRGRRSIGCAADDALDRGPAQDRATGGEAVSVDRRRRRRLRRRCLCQDPCRRVPGAALLDAGVRRPAAGPPHQGRAGCPAHP